jgi:hypothetical protein
MAAKLTRLTHKIAIQLHLVAESCTICSSRSTRPVRKLLVTASFVNQCSVRIDTVFKWNLLKDNTLFIVIVEYLVFVRKILSKRDLY